MDIKIERRKLGKIGIILKSELGLERGLKRGGSKYLKLFGYLVSVFKRGRSKYLELFCYLVCVLVPITFDSPRFDMMLECTSKLLIVLSLT